MTDGGASIKICPQFLSLVLFTIGRNETKHCGKFKDFFIDAPVWTTALGVEWSIFHVGISFAIKNRPTHAEGWIQSNKCSDGVCRFNLLPLLRFIIHLLPCGLLFHPFCLGWSVRWSTSHESATTRVATFLCFHRDSEGLWVVIHPYQVCFDVADSVSN